MINLIKKTNLYHRYEKIKADRNKLFPGKPKLVDLRNTRYITRKPVYDFLIANMEYISGNVLDFGCGSMEYRGILKKTETYVGLDIEGDKRNQDVIYYDGVHIPFESGRFDAVISIEVFEHVEYLEEVLLELNRVMKMGGRMFFTVPMNFPGHMEPYDFRRFTKYGIIKKLETVGFTVEKISGTTTFRNTIRRMEILELEKRKGRRSWYFIIKCIVNNICFLVSNKVLEDEKTPIGWSVVCRKT